MKLKKVLRKAEFLKTNQMKTRKNHFTFTLSKTKKRKAYLFHTTSNLNTFSLKWDQVLMKSLMIYVLSQEREKQIQKLLPRSGFKT